MIRRVFNKINLKFRTLTRLLKVKISCQNQFKDFLSLSKLIRAPPLIQKKKMTVLTLKVFDIRFIKQKLQALLALLELSQLNFKQFRKYFKF